jgi:hypothetical protein
MKGRTGQAEPDRQDWIGRTRLAARTCCKDKTARAGQPGEDRKDIRNRTARTGQAEKDRQSKTAMTGFQGQDSGDRAARIRRQLRTARIRQPEKDTQNRTAKPNQLKQDSQRGAAGMRHAGQNRQDETSRTGLPAQDCHYRAAMTGLP